MLMERNAHPQLQPHKHLEHKTLVYDKHLVNNSEAGGPWSCTQGLGSPVKLKWWPLLSLAFNTHWRIQFPLTGGQRFSLFRVEETQTPRKWPGLLLWGRLHVGLHSVLATSLQFNDGHFVGTAE